MENIITVKNLGKRYKLGQIGARTLRDELENLFGINRAARGEQPRNKDFWALRDVSFDVAPGKIVGIVGSNGAGKSTLLKILSRITAPTRGDITIYGRTASLLEVGTGFHPELTGRENVFLNGAILGMKRAEIQQHYSAIVDFAELHEFMGTPVKRYSSGMFVRLAFAVAAHLQPEILIVDEVLAVGDIRFQRKCLGKMKDVAGGGRTILFVSHNSAAIEDLCERVIWLKDGQVQNDGPTHEVLSEYLGSFVPDSGSVRQVSSDGTILIREFRLLDEAGQPTVEITPGQTLTAELVVEARRTLKDPRFSFQVKQGDALLFGANQVIDGCNAEHLEGCHTVRCHFPAVPLMPRQSFMLSAAIREGNPPVMQLKDVNQPFRTVGTARDMGFSGRFAETFVPGTSPIALPYQWEMDGTLSSPVINESPARRPPQ